MGKTAALLSLTAVSLIGAELNQSGYIRGMYVGDDKVTSAAMGGSIGIAPKFGDIKTQVAFYGVSPLGAREDAVERHFSSKTDGYAVLGLASLTYEKNDLSATIGRQKITTPLIDMDDGRIIPNLYEGISLKYDIDAQNRVEAYYLSKMSGFWTKIYGESDIGRFVSMSRAAGYGDVVSNSGVWSIGATHNSNVGYISLFAYHSPNLLNLLYGEAKKSFTVFGTDSIELSLQGSRQSATGDLQSYLNAKDKTLDQNYVGAKITLTSAKSTLHAAAAKVSDAKGRLDKNMMNVWAGIPQYTTLNEHVMKSFDVDGAKLYKIGVGYDFGDSVTTTASYLYVDTLKTKNVDSGVVELTLSKQSGGFFANGIILHRNDGNQNKTTIFKSTLEYRF